MTIGAPDMGMTPKERETGLTGVIELLCVPVGGGMTVAALLALIALVNVIRRVAAETFRGQVLISFAGVTRWAGRLRVFARQCEGCLVMIEVRAVPGLCVVTGGAIGPQRTLVGIIPGMAATTHRWCITIDVAYGASSRPGLVTTFAACGDVGIVEREVRELVGKSNLAEPGDVGVAAEVLGVTSTALTSGCLSHPAVITAFRTHILGDLFVTGEALSVLPFTIGEIVALRAFGLDSGVRLGDGTGHHELLDAGCAGTRVEQQHERRENKRSRVAG